jgi:hypothetical protein
MKHIFFVHSHITYLVSCGVIKREAIDKSNCAFVVDRSYRIPTGKFVSYDFPFQTYPEHFGVHRKFWVGWYKLMKLDRFILIACSRENYIFYFPKTDFGFFGLVISHKLCKGFSIIEEGLVAYWEKSIFDHNNPVKKLPVHRRLLMSLNYFYRMPTLKYSFDPRYINIYCVSDFAFRGYDRKVVLDLNFETHSEQIINDSTQANVLVFDAIVEYSIVTLANFLSALERLLKALASNSVTHMYFKFHPQQYVTPESANQIRKVFANFAGLMEFRELADTISLELLAVQLKPNFYVNTSSVGVYAALFGCTVYSYAYFIIDAEPAYQKIIDKLPDIFREKIMFLEPEARNI